jgi:nucleotide-binding universal stress UspA family protein
VCGVDETAESLEAVRQAARLRSAEGSLHLLAAVYLAGAIVAGWPAERIASELDEAVGDVVRRAEALAGERVTSKVVNAPAVESLLAEIRQEKATVICVGSHSHHRLPGIVVGYVATAMLHEAPCSVLVARKPSQPDDFPRSIVVGIDGSPQATAAHEVASELAARFDVELRPVCAYGGMHYVDTDAVIAAFPDLSLDEREAVEALLAASVRADLVVVGSRGLHGLRALGSVSERIAHRANCTVLVVREQPGASL